MHRALCKLSAHNYGFKFQVIQTQSALSKGKVI